MEGVEMKPSLSLGLVQMMQQSVQHQQMSAGGQFISLQPSLTSGSSLSDDPIQVETAMQITSRDGMQLFLLNSAGGSIGLSPVCNTQSLNRKVSPLRSGQFRTPSFSVDQGMAGRHPSPSGGHPPQVTYQHFARAGSQSAVHPASHGAFRAVVSPCRLQDICV